MQQPPQDPFLQKPTHRSPAYNPYPDNKKKIPKYGKPALCVPIGFPHAARFEAVKWAWFPEWSKLTTLVAAVSVFFALGFLLLLLGSASSSRALIAVGAILVILTCPFLYILSNWMWNARKQEAHSHARFKSIEAESLWRSVDPQFQYQAKDLYFETGYGGKRLKVLRDGTIEVHGAHNAFGGEDGGGDGGGEGDGGDFDATEVQPSDL